MKGSYLNSYLVIAIFGIIYLFFPTGNSTLDAWCYAAEIRYGSDLFHPHHLLYNATAFILLKALSLNAENTLVYLKVMNALMATFSLLVLMQVLRNLKNDYTELPFYLLIAGASFSIMRFATENETYILPLFFSIVSLHFFIIFNQKGRLSAIILSGAMAAIACLYHQLHFFWWFAMICGLFFWYKKYIPALLFFLPSVAVLIAYSLVLVVDRKSNLTLTNLWNFTFEAFYIGEAKTKLGLNNIFFTITGLIRSFIQIHGNIPLILKRNSLFYLPVLVSAVLGVYSLFFLKGIKWRLGEHKNLLRVLLLIITLHIFFAALLQGEIEFLVMIPFLVIMVVFICLKVDYRFLALSGCALLIWNFSLAIVPNHVFNYSGDEAIRNLVLAKHEDLFILNEDVKVKNEIFYYQGIKDIPNIIKSPSNHVNKGLNYQSLFRLTDSCLREGNFVYTDCISRPLVLSRATLLKNDADATFFSAYNTELFDSITTFYGTVYIHRIISRKANFQK